jgi:HAD superfamily hydrolase (TIGR01509 family)
MTIRGVLLDVDGTLLDSNDAHAHAWVEAFAENGYAVSFERVRPLMGMGGDKLMPAVIPGLSSEEGLGKQIADRRKAIFLQRYAPHLQPTRGARDLVLRFQQDGLRLVVATSAKSDELEALLDAAKVADLLPRRTTTDDVDTSKPDADIIHVALQKLEVGPTEAILVGDTPYDIEAGQKAGVGTIALRCGGFPNSELQGALAIFDDPAALLA